MVETAERHVVRYTAAGGVVVHGGRVLVLRRPSRSEVRLPKGHVEPGEDLRATALRETREESGYADLAVKADLGVQVVEFDCEGRHVVRIERYFLMAPVDGWEALPVVSPSTTLRTGLSNPPENGEEQFEPLWLHWDEALAALTFEAEREWVRRARRVSEPVLSTVEGSANQRGSEEVIQRVGEVG